MKPFSEMSISEKVRKALFLGAFLASSSLVLACGSNTVSSVESSDPAVTSEAPKALDHYELTANVANDQGLCYEIFVPAFADSNGDGVGDFNGIAAKADYLASLGVNRVWLMPIHPTSSYHGYDVNDFYGVNSKFGTMADFESMVATLKSKGINVIIDMVLNHSGKSNPWFAQSARDFMEGNINDDSKADWYSFSYESKSGYAGYQGIYYECNFSDTMPEFNWDSEGFRAEVKSILNYWLDKGVEGFRLDAVLYYKLGDAKGNKECCDYLREATKEKHPDCYFVGEAWTDNGILLNSYFPSKLDSYFDFDHSMAGENTMVNLAKGMLSGTMGASDLADYVNAIKAKNAAAIPSFFISNHDTNRPCNSLYTANWRKLAASVTYLLPGTPYIYYGEEINLYGMRGSEQTDGMRRLPMVWKLENDAYRCNVPDAAVKTLASTVTLAEMGVDDEQAVGLSVVNHYKKVGNVRNRLKGIVDATMEAVSEKDEMVMHYILHADKDYHIIHNLAEEAVEVEIPANLALFDSIDSQGSAPTLLDGKLHLAPCSSAILN